MYEILKGRGLPPPTTNHKPVSKYPFSELSVGDCFFAPGKQTFDMSAFHNAAKRFAKHVPGFRIAIRKEVHNGQSGLMIYRVN